MQCVLRNFLNFISHQILLRDEIENCKVGGWFGTCAEEERGMQVWDKLKERDRFGDLNMDWEYNTVTGLERNEWNNLNHIQPVQQV